MGDRLGDIEKSLEQRFLYNNDPISMHILLSMLDHRRFSGMTKPQYVLMKRLMTSLRRFLKDRKDREYVIRALRRLINDDVNRFELAIVIEVNSLTQASSYWTDRLERLALEFYTPEELSGKHVLFHHVRKGRAMGLKSQLFHDLKRDTEGFRVLKHLGTMYCRKVLKKKVYRLNDYIDKQIVLDFDHLDRLKLEENLLTVRDLSHLYHKLNQYMYNNITKVYKEAFWAAINDSVLERYSR